MSNSLEQQFGDLNLSQEDHDQIFEQEDHQDQSRSRILISGLSMHARFDTIEPLLSQYGNVQQCDKINSRDANTQAVYITFETPEQAQQAINGLNGCEVEGARIKVEAADGMARGGRRGRPGGGRGGGGALGGGSRPTDFPLRLLVQSDMVGAIIGRQGSTIRLITQQSRARVDVHRKDNVGSLEKAITIYGNPDNCTNACKRILEVMQQEANNTNKGEICLKILAHNNLIGRIIGKGGNTIKRIMQETDTKITVSSINDINSFNLERIITVKGTIENMAKAESQISAKLRQSYENDLQVLAPQSIMFPGLHPMAMMSTGRGFCGAPPPFPPPIYAPLAGQGGAQQGAGDSQETTYLYIPNNAVGAIIGTKGSHIRNIIRFSNASVKIAPLEQDKVIEGVPGAGAVAAPGSVAAQQERKVTIVGSPEAQWKAQYLIFEKMREEGFMSGSDDVRLTVAIVVASSQVGRIIGKGGQNVRELQRVTGSLIKLPEQPQPPTAAGNDHETTVHIVGHFYSVQSAQRRIRSMVAQASAPGRHRRAAPPPPPPAQQ
ncbi:insulin-like growth factor 2 mRNA-binding protein 1 isoform X1 [Danaus plexippus]|uniref:insulin-like growth factor 2 mRNA-binding protein 1 isoform X1 n=1 Tax=Danaus plexippus TaxID=13037 RepID=UPI0013C3EB0F|nr:insulin-like growth factor 2 mRNA-binding protein 1 isoform X1 [Danaus plexippus plexippus]XP_061382583.1 insulin-like growth factor 2 mRNA-binding protein 1 isoform X1 [Danaus plexippus]XP_061382584.1 insulin-like growth factor 2 mRNA-binding protein 1 isoform X1 [Danaus plexippus]XP_061382585.1 insulin-like growth factor 2 mRNA-binding protein 1 isoform X1 [Danaus plexippus]XP_061382587.1 insulin-like growth factor 2 mRNA-binding protein 1 isoform X1 [Danaus plexippus]